MRLLKFTVWNVVPAGCPGFQFQSITITVETDAGVQDQFDVEEDWLPADKQYLFIEEAKVKIFVEYTVSTDEGDGIMDESEDLSEEMSEEQPSESRESDKLSITAKSKPEIQLSLNDECFDIDLFLKQEEIPDLGKFYEEVEARETKEAAVIFSEQTKETCEELIIKYLGSAKKINKSAPVQISGFGGFGVSSIATEDPLYTLVILDDKTEILAEHFQHKGIPHRRPIQVRIPLRTILGGFTFDKTNRGVAAIPLSVLSGWGTGKLQIDQDYNADGEYDKGHLMPSASGAPHNSYIIVPMLQFINQYGGWKQMERKLGRFLCQLPNTHRKPEPYPGEAELAAALHGCFMQGDKRWNCYLRIIISYAGADDERIPTAFSASLNRYKDNMTIEEFGGEIKHTGAGLVQAEVSEELAKVFQLAVETLAELDNKYGKAGWDPVQPWKSPPRGFPEHHLPRPYRALDLLFSEKFPNLRKKAFEILEGSGEDEELFADVSRVTIGSGYGFAPAQRHLAFLFNLWNNENKFLSDLRPGAVKVASEIQPLYIDQHAELQFWGGHNQAQADHHVPKSTGSGTNYFTNLLYISRQQNLRAETQNKPFKLTNPNFKDDSEEFMLTDAGDEKKARQTTAEATVTRNILTANNLTRTEVVKHFIDRWRREEVAADEFLISVAGNFWELWFHEKKKFLPWTWYAKQTAKDTNRLFFK